MGETVTSKTAAKTSETATGNRQFIRSISSGAIPQIPTVGGQQAIGHTGNVRLKVVNMECISQRFLWKANCKSSLIVHAN